MYKQTETQKYDNPAQMDRKHSVGSTDPFNETGTGTQKEGDHK